MPKSKRPPDLETERGKRRQELPGDQDQRAEQRADSLRPVQVPVDVMVGSASFRN